MRIVLVLIAALIAVSCAHNPSTKEKTWNAQTYKNNSHSQMNAAHQALKRITLRGNERVLDVGCGDGKVTAAIAEQVVGGVVIGVDVSKSMIDFATRSFSDLKNLRFQKIDVADMRFSDDFDVVVSFSAVQWFLDQKKAFSHIFRSLKSGGAFLMALPSGYPEPLQQALDDLVTDDKWQKYFTRFRLGQVFHTRDEYEAILREQGFHQIIVEEVPAYDRFTNRDAFKDFVQQWLPHLVPIPKEEHERFMTELMDRYEHYQAPEADGSVWFNKTQIEAVAKKG